MMKILSGSLFLLVTLLHPFPAQVLATELTLENLEQKWSSNKLSFISLKNGRTHYQHSNNNVSDNSLVVLVHGVSGPMTAWDKNVSVLSDNRISFLRYDLYGRGFSERITEEYNLNLYLSQLEGLVEKFGRGKELILVGSSFGCVIVSAYAQKFSEKVKKIIFIGPAGFPIKVPFLAKMRDIPLLGNLIFNFFGRKIILEQNQKYFVDTLAWESHKGYFKDQLAVNYSDKAILSTMRHSPVQDYLDGFDKLGRKEIPIEVIWGENDATFPYYNNKILKKKIPHMKLSTIRNSGHLPQYERSNEINNLLLKILKDEQ